MRKNVASQTVGAQMITAADGTAFTGTVSVLVTGDAGTQTAGGGTAPAHEGNGYHSYTPTQAETNYNHIAFTFTGTGAIPATVQVYTNEPQTGDSFARIGLNGAGLTDINLPNQTMDIVGNITGNLSGSVGSVTGAVDSVTGAVGSVTGAVGSVTAGVTLAASAVQAIWDALTTALTTTGSIGKRLADYITGDAFVRLGAPSGASVSADIAAVKTDTAAIKTKTDSLTFTVANQVDSNIQSVNDITVTGTGAAGSEWGP